MRSRIVAGVLALGLATTMLAACSSGGRRGAGASTLRVAISEPAGLDPIRIADNAGTQVGRLLFEGLTATDDRLAVVPAVAESWSVDPQTGRTYTFILRSGVKFSNGQPVTANDFAFAFARLADPDSESPFGALGSPIAGWTDVHSAAPDGQVANKRVAGVKVVDDRTLTITTSEPYALLPALLSQLAFAPVPNTATDPSFADRPIGTGPYAMAEAWQHNRSITLRRNNDYFGTPPATANIAFLIQPDVATGYTQLQKRAVDIAAVPVGNTTQAQKEFGSRVKTWSNGQTRALGFPTRVKPFDDPALRRALSLTVDRAALANRLLDTTASPATGIVAPLGENDTTMACADCRFDPAAAKKLIGAKKYPRLALYVGSGDPYTPALQAIADGWRINLGVDVQVIERDSTQLQAQITNQQLDGMFSIQWGPNWPSAYAVLEPWFATNGRANVFAFSSRVVDDQLAAARRATNAAATQPPLVRAEQGVTSELPALPLVFTSVAYATSSPVRDFEVDALGSMLLERVRLA